MADTSLKRPHPDDGDLKDQKRARSNNGSPRTTALGTGEKPDVNQMLAQARAKAAELKARISGQSTTSASGSVPSTIATPSPADRLAQLKARVAAATSRSQTLAQSKTPTPVAPERGDDLSKARGGLDIGLHPALLGDGQRDATPRTQQKYHGAGQRNAARKSQQNQPAPSSTDLKRNPYYNESASVSSVGGKARPSRQLIFNQQGKYIQQAAALRRQAQLEEMKKRIAARARQVGIDEDLDTEKAFQVQAPPDIEWWDEGLVKGTSYDAIDDAANLKIDTPDSIITVYIQHPVLIEPPQEKQMPAAKPMYLTSKEQAKRRRQNRMENLKEEQMKIRLGLIPAPPPKVKRSNFMRVLGEEAIQDPTAVEARVNREIAERKNKHEAMNEDRKLTKEQKHEKLEKNQVQDEARGIHQRVYKIDSLANGKHRYQIAVNAKQRKLTGVCVMHPKMNLVVVEGGEYSIRHYDKLMQNRIRWQEMEAPKAVEEGNREELAKWLEAQDENGELKDLSMNSCQLIFAGEAKQRAFRNWLGARVCETDSQAKDVLSRAKMDSFWNVAKGHKE